MANIDSAPADLAKHPESLSPEAPIFTFLLVKLASRCNINCTYCYWFRDAEVFM